MRYPAIAFLGSAATRCYPLLTTMPVSTFNDIWLCLILYIMIANPHNSLLHSKSFINHANLENWKEKRPNENVGQNV